MGHPGSGDTTLSLRAEGGAPDGADALAVKHPTRLEVWMRRAVFVSLILVGLAGCTREQRSPDAIRNDTAHATAGVVRDTKAVAEGVVDGLRQKGPVNINKASSDDLQRLPGVTPDMADRIIAGRPYQEGADLYHRHIVSKAEYNQIAGKIEAR